MPARFGVFEIDSARRLLCSDDREVHLTPKAFDLLSILVDAAPRVVSKAELHARLWPRTVVADGTLVGLVKEIRRGLADHNDEGRIIRTVHRVGYAFDLPVAHLPNRTSVSSCVLTAGRHIALALGENVIGRDPDAAIFLDYPTVSRRHARIVLTPVSAVLEDLGSKNGTTIAGKPLDSRVALRDGDCFECAQVSLTYRQTSASMPTETHASPGFPAAVRG